MNKLFRISAVFMAASACVNLAQAAVDDNVAASIAGDYWSVESDVVYGVFQQDCRVDLEKDGRISLVDFPVVECFKVLGDVVEDGGRVVLRFPNGQTVWKNSYGEFKYFWVAAPDDPTYGYTVDVDEYIDFDYDAETGVISWEAPMNDAKDTWLRFMMVGGYYFDSQAGYKKVSGTYHYTDVKLYPVNALFTATRMDGVEEGIDPEIQNKVKVEVKDNKLHVFGLLHINHGVALTFDVDKDSGEVSVAGMSELGEFEDEGMFYIAPLADNDADIVGKVEITDDGSVITFEELHATTANGTLSAGKYTDCKLTVPFDIFERLTGIAQIDAEDSSTAPVYYNLQGQRVSKPSSGVYLRRQGSTVERVVVK